MKEGASPAAQAQGSEALPERLARELMERITAAVEGRGDSLILQHEVAAAIRAALDEAVRVTLRSRATADMDAEDYRESIAAAIEALKGLAPATEGRSPDA